MEYHTEGPQKGHIKLADKNFPQNLYDKTGKVVVARNEQEKARLIATGDFSTKVYDKDVHK